jgi:hypothetical protein
VLRRRHTAGGDRITDSEVQHVVNAFVAELVFPNLGTSVFHT